MKVKVFLVINVLVLMSSVITGTWGATTLSNASGSGPNHTLPVELLEVCRKHGLDEVADFLGLSPENQNRKPYVNGLIDGPEKDIAAFWCVNKDEQRYFLAVMVKVTDAPLKSCPEVQEVLNEPVGLTARKNFNYPGAPFLDWAYVYKIDKVPPGSQAAGPLIISGDQVSVRSLSVSMANGGCTV